MRVRNSLQHCIADADSSRRGFDLVFHYEDEKTYVAVYTENDVMGFERRSSQGQSPADQDYMTS